MKLRKIFIDLLNNISINSTCCRSNCCTKILTIELEHNDIHQITNILNDIDNILMYKMIKIKMLP